MKLTQEQKDRLLGTKEKALGNLIEALNKQGFYFIVEENRIRVPYEEIKDAQRIYKFAESFITDSHYCEWVYSSSNSIVLSLARLSIAQMFDGALAGGHGRSYFLSFNENLRCFLTGKEETCLFFDSSDGEYAQLQIGITVLKQLISTIETGE